MSPETPTEPWKKISTDFIVGLLQAMGFDALLVVVDCTKKQIHVITNNGGDEHTGAS